MKHKHAPASGVIYTWFHGGYAPQEMLSGCPSLTEADSTLARGALFPHGQTMLLT